MRFTVVALDSVENALAALYLEAPDPQAVADASNWLEQQLRNDPLMKVTPHEELYFLQQDPLVALCKISVDDRLVTIVAVHRSDEQ